MTGIKGGGALEKYVAVKALEPFISKDMMLERMVPFRLPEVVTQVRDKVHAKFDKVAYQREYMRRRRAKT